MEPEPFAWLTAALPRRECGEPLGLLVRAERPVGSHRAAGCRCDRCRPLTKVPIRRLISVGNLCNRIYPNSQGCRRRRFCGVCGQPRSALHRFRRVKRSFYEVEGTPGGGSPSGPSGRTFSIGRGPARPSPGGRSPGSVRKLPQLPGLSPAAKLRGRGNDRRTAICGIPSGGCRCGFGS